MATLFVDNLTVLDFSYLHAKRGMVGESWIVDLELSGEVLPGWNVYTGYSHTRTEDADGVRLTTYDPVFAAQMEVAERIMREDRELLRKLAQ